eukprot:3443862-Alexandrium_andersonii.AAC.1
MRARGLPQRDPPPPHCGVEFGDRLDAPPGGEAVQARVRGLHPCAGGRGLRGGRVSDAGAAAGQPEDPGERGIAQG